MPGVERYSVDMAVRMAEKAAARHSRHCPFPREKLEVKTEDGAFVASPDNLINRAVRAIKKEVPEIGIITDAALDPFTTHGHDGIFAERRDRQRRIGRHGGSRCAFAS